MGAFIDEKGREVIDSTPVELPVGYKRPETLAEKIRRLARQELSQLAAEQNMETLEEADDFEVGDDFDPHSPYENDFDPSIEQDREELKKSMVQDEPQVDEKNEKQPEKKS